jgi:hypothetical protein
MQDNCYWNKDNCVCGCFCCTTSSNDVARYIVFGILLLVCIITFIVIPPLLINAMCECLQFWMVIIYVIIAFAFCGCIVLSARCDKGHDTYVVLKVIEV